jgi:hypothetical protein
LLLLACAFTLTGCSSVGTINGTQCDSAAVSEHPQICANILILKFAPERDGKVA